MKYILIDCSSGVVPAPGELRLFIEQTEQWQINLTKDNMTIKKNKTKQ